MGDVTAHDAVLDANFKAQAAELALRGHLQFLERLGIQEIGMRIEPADHAVDGFLDEFFIGNRFDVVALDLAEDGRQELQILVGDRRLGFALRDGREIERYQYAQDSAQPDQSRFFPAVAFFGWFLLAHRHCVAPAFCEGLGVPARAEPAALSVDVCTQVYAARHARQGDKNATWRTPFTGWRSAVRDRRLHR